MTSYFKTKKHLAIFLILLLSTLLSYSQEAVSDKEIGLDVERISIVLQERGITNPEDLQREIDQMRKMYQVQYIEIQKNKNELLQRKQLLKAGTNIVTDIPQSEKDALKSIYDNTNGSNWTNKTGWDFSTPVSSWNNTLKTGWYGVTINNGHVTSLDLNTNNLTGFIPSEIGQLKFLELLYFHNNSLNGSIPSSIGELVLLRNLYLMSNSLSSSIPLEIEQLTQLTALVLNSNKLNGSIPTGICNLKKLYTLSLNINELTGSIPSEIGNLTVLQTLNLGYNKLNGTIPSSFYNLTKLSTFYLDYNSINGILSSQISNLTDLRDCRIPNNQLSGNIPPQIGQLVKLQTLDLRKNQLSGSIPLEIGQLQQLFSLILYGNELSGSIPAEIGLLRNLSVLWLHENQFINNVPSEIKNLSKLSSLYIYSNKLSGSVPDLSNLNLLTGLDIRFNGFQFIDFSSQFLLYKTKMGSNFKYSTQGWTDIAKTVNSPIGSLVTMMMYEDNRFTPDDTFQWYKNSAVINGATSRTLTISNLKLTDSGTYFCRASHTSNPDMSPLILERAPINLNVVNCTPIVGTIKTESDKFYTNSEVKFSFETTALNLSYLWTISTLQGQIVSKGTITNSLCNYTFTNEGDYIIALVATDTKGCYNTFTKNIKVIKKYCNREPANFVFETESSNLNFTWTTTNPLGVIVNKTTNTSGAYTFTPQVTGQYEIQLTTNGTGKCETFFSKKIQVESCEPSCVKTNPNTPKIKSLFTALLSKLQNQPVGTVTNGYKCAELTALQPYIKEENPAIYNFKKDNFVMSFSFTDHEGYDIQLGSDDFNIKNINLDDYESPYILTNVHGDHIDAYVSRIDFCSELYCVSHVALIVDESGSISATELSKIKKQLKKYIQQQAYDNDKLQSNVYVSLTGMSDSDTNKRIDNISAIRLTNEAPAVLNAFNNWIDKYGTRNGTPGVSASSDYWKSALDVALNSSMKPNIVMMITDGCETNNVGQLKETMSQFNNSKNPLEISPGKPHLYVVGIENGFYVDGSLGTTTLARYEDPNYIQTLSAGSNESRVVAHLTTSLKYLLSYPETDFPVASIDNFGGADYFGYENFDSLGILENETFFSDKLKLSHFACGDPADKNYCSDCLSFQPIPEKEYMLSAWVKEESFIQIKTYQNAVINVIFYNDVIAEDLYRISTKELKASGDIIDGWQRITANFLIPKGTKTIGIELENKSSGIPAYFDDIRIHPLDGSVKTFVYDSETFKLMSELDENNYSTFYEYDNEGGLVRIKKETAKGVKTIQETRSGNIINN